VDPRLVALLGRVWPALPPAITRAEALGFSWADVSTPLVRHEGPRAIAHVGVIALPLIVDGRPRTVASIHAVCTDPARRRRGHAEALMHEALTYCRARYETVLLTTLIPGFYARHGFRPVPEHAFTRALPLDRRSGGGRRLSGSAEDVALLRRLLAGRAPVSQRLAALEGGTVFVLALLLTWGGFSRAHYHADLDVLTVHEVVGRTLMLYDVVGRTIPALEALTAAIGADADRVVTLFVPERLGEGFTPEAWSRACAGAAGDAEFAGLMARGAFDVGTDAFMLPPLTRT
jgi:ribosomal protein S18 acetylase RimI-like enzyme